MAQEKMRIGCQEWCAFPELHIVSMRAKIDTGAKTSALHAEDIHVIEKSGKAYVQFLVPPFPGEVDTAKQCEMPIIDRRYITSSNSTKERRYIISTAILMGGVTHKIELSLTDRRLMRFNALLGREALSKFAIIDPSKKYLLGTIPEQKK